MSESVDEFRVVTPINLTKLPYPTALDGLPDHVKSAVLPFPTTVDPPEESPVYVSGTLATVIVPVVGVTFDGTSIDALALPPPFGKVITEASLPFSNSVCLPSAPQPGASHRQSIDASLPTSTAGFGQTPTVA